MSLLTPSPCVAPAPSLGLIAPGNPTGATGQSAGTLAAGRLGALTCAVTCAVTCALAGTLAACSLALDWRDVRPAGSGALLLMPCKPQAQERRVLLAGQSTRLTLHVCTADEKTWGLAFAEVADPARTAEVLQSLLQTAGANVSATASQVLPLAVRGATPNPSSRRVAYQGRLPDGRAVQMQVAVFAHGLRAFQATALGSELPAEEVQNFMASIRFAD